MSGTRTARRVRGRAGCAGALLALSLGAAGDDADSTHRLGVDQSRDSFQHKLERIRKSARERATREFDPSEFAVERPESPPGYHGAQRLRLTPKSPAGAEPPEARPPATRADDDADALAERRRRQLYQSQRARGLHEDLPPGAERPGRADYEARHEQRKRRSEQRADAFHRKLMR